MTNKISTIVIPELEFDFNTMEEYYSARCTGYIEDYKMARIERIHKSGTSIDYPCHSKEGLLKQIHEFSMDETVVSFRAYQSTHYYDVRDYD